jgi:hypothetical protein
VTVGGAGFDATVQLIDNIILDNALNILDRGRAELAGSSSDQFMVLNSIQFSGNGTLNLRDRDFILNYTGTTQLGLVQSKINSARNGGAWNGTGITSSNAGQANPRNTTLGAMEATDFKSIYGANAQFHEYPPDNTAVLVRYTYYGDADFNGRVNFDDYVRTDNGYNNHRSGWLNGDFDGNGQVNFDDYVLIDLAFNTQSGTLGR